MMRTICGGGLLGMSSGNGRLAGLVDVWGFHHVKRNQPRLVETS